MRKLEKFHLISSGKARPEMDVFDEGGAVVPVHEFVSQDEGEQTTAVTAKTAKAAQTAAGARANGSLHLRAGASVRRASSWAGSAAGLPGTILGPAPPGDLARAIPRLTLSSGAPGSRATSRLEMGKGLGGPAALGKGQGKIVVGSRVGLNFQRRLRNSHAPAAADSP